MHDPLEQPRATRSGEFSKSVHLALQFQEGYILSLVLGPSHLLFFLNILASLSDFANRPVLQ